MILTTQKSEELVKEFKNLIGWWIKRYRADQYLEDLQHEGYLLLFKAWSKFDDKKGCSFKTYFTWQLRGYMQQRVRDYFSKIRVPQNKLDEYNSYSFEDYETAIMEPTRNTVNDSIDLHEYSDELKIAEFIETDIPEELKELAKHILLLRSDKRILRKIDKQFIEHTEEIKNIFKDYYFD